MKGLLQRISLEPNRTSSRNRRPRRDERSASRRSNLQNSPRNREDSEINVFDLKTVSGRPLPSFLPSIPREMVGRGICPPADQGTPLSPTSDQEVDYLQEEYLSIFRQHLGEFNHQNSSLEQLGRSSPSFPLSTLDLLIPRPEDLPQIPQNRSSGREQNISRPSRRGSESRRNPHHRTGGNMN